MALLPLSASALDGDPAAFGLNWLAQNGGEEPPPHEGEPTGQPPGGAIDGTDDTDEGEDPVVNVRAYDPDTPDALALAAAATPGSGSWDESATRTYYDSIIKLAWREEMGDRGTTLLGQVEVQDLNSVRVVRMPVTGNNFYITTDRRGSAYFVSREGTLSQRPTLVVNGRTYQATRDTFLSTTSSGTQAGEAILRNRDVMLIAFDGYAPQASDRGELRLTTTAQYATHTMFAYAPDVRPIYPTIPSRVDPTVVAAFTGASFRPKPNISVASGVATGFIEGATLAHFSQLFVLPAADEYYMTAVVKLHADWPNRGGKLPGLANSGQATNTAGLSPCVIEDGTRLGNAGWGGRPANGCRWSARTGWSGRNGDRVGAATYFYANAPRNGSYGVMQFWQTPITVNRWFAYVQRVRINTPGEANGQLSYWLCTESGCQPQFHRADIAWRTSGVDQSRISELWANIYCGGTVCGVSPWPRSTASIKRMTVTRGLPDMAALAAEVVATNQ